MALKCPFCKDASILPIDKKNVAEHLIVVKDKENHTHVHGPVGNKSVIQDLVMCILKEAGIAYSIAPREPAEKVPNDNKTED